MVRGLGAERWPMGGRSEPGGGKEVKSLPLHSFPGLTWWRKSKTAVLLEVWNHRIARATRECCSCLLPSQPNIQSLGTSGGLCLLHPFSPHTAATPALSRPPSHGTTHNSQRVSLKTQVRSCHFSAQNRAGLLISFSVGAEVLTVALRWALPLPQRSVSILIPPGLRWSLQEHRFLCPPRVLPPWSFAPLSLELTPLDHHSALRHSPRWVSTQLSPVRGPPLSTLSPTHTHVLDFIHPLSFVFT